MSNVADVEFLMSEEKSLRDLISLAEKEQEDLEVIAAENACDRWY